MFRPDDGSSRVPAAGAEQEGNQQAAAAEAEQTDAQRGGKLSPGRQAVWNALIENVDVDASERAITDTMLENLDRVAPMGLMPAQRMEADRIITEVGGDEFFHQVRDAHYPSGARWGVFEELAKLLGES